MEEEQMLIGNTFGGGEQTINIKDDKWLYAVYIVKRNTLRFKLNISIAFEICKRCNKNLYFLIQLFR